MRLIAAAVATTALAGAGCGSAGPTPPYAATALDTGATVSVDQYRGTPVLLAAWATWCVPCERELPELDAFAASPAADGVAVVAVNVDDASTGRGDVDAMIERLDVSLPVWRDTDGELLTRYGGSLMPFSVLLDRNGEVADSWVGTVDVDGADFRAAIASVTG
jgi:thiol-disulfide isomerase/thioredoxin